MQTTHRIPSQPSSILEALRDVIVFLALSAWYVCEALFLTILPDSLRPGENLKGKVVLITGGGGGLGRKLAKEFAKREADVILWDINKTGLEEAVEALASEGVNVRSAICDVSDRSSVYREAERLLSTPGARVDILVNNAAIVTCRPLLDIPDAAVERTYNVNILSNYWTVKAFLPSMISRGTGHIVTIASVTGLLGTYGCTDYSATKFAAVGFHESLYTELKTHGHDGINCTLVCPYYIDTGMFAGVQPRFRPMLKPEYVAQRVVRAVRYHEVNCTLPGFVRTLLPLKCLLPAKMCWALMFNIMQGPQSMMKFRGRISNRNIVAAQG